MSRRAAASILALVSVLGVAAWLLPMDSSAAWFLRVVGAAFVVGVAPGALAVLAWQPRPSIGVLELAGISVGISFALVQLLTFGALILHWTVDVSLLILAGWLFGHAVVAFRPGRPRVEVRASHGELALVFAVIAVGGVLYMIGSPFESAEDRIHIGIVQRLLALSSPAIDTIYVVPDIVYTYPFPGTHYLLALMARLGDVDPMFLYHKMRAFWGMASLSLLYGCAAVMFGSTRIALATTFVAIGFVANGMFAAVPGFHWAQLIPYSHASDTAMGVLLPALLLLAFEFVVADRTRERRFFQAATIGLAAAVIAVHPREIVQFLVYFMAFGVALVAFRGPRRALAGTAVLVLTTLGSLLVYLAWHTQAVRTVDTLISEHRLELRALFLQSSWSDLLGQPRPLLGAYVADLEPLFYGWTPIVLLVSPLVLLLMRRQVLVWLVGGAIVSYLAIIRFPLLAIPYIYFTYFEILQTPVRNLIFFVHVLTGVCLYVAAAGLARYRYVLGLPAAVALSVVTAAAVERVGPAMVERPDLLFGWVLVVYADVVLAWWLWRMRDRAARDNWILDPHPRWVLVLVVLVVPLLGLTRVPERSMLESSWTGSAPTPDKLRASLPCRDVSCPPPKDLIQFVQASVPVESVFAIDVSEEYQSSLFMPQQMATWPGPSAGLLTKQIFPRYFEHYERTQAAYDVQPLFNDRETLAERMSFIRDLRVTHVLVSPRLYGMMSRVLTTDPDVFIRRYDSGRWAVYEVGMQQERGSL